MTIGVRDLLPMFTATQLADRTRVDYQDVWQRKNLVLVTLRDDDSSAASYVASLNEFGFGLVSENTVLIVTTTRIEGIPSPGVVVADRWGEVYYVKDARSASELTTPGELLEWIRYVRNECPECQGETR